jgi:hypothetical protein
MSPIDAKDLAPSDLAERLDSRADALARATPQMSLWDLLSMACVVFKQGQHQGAGPTGPEDHSEVRTSLIL